MASDKIKHGRSKLISNYGGVGSIIETQDCSVIVETFDNWRYGTLQNKLSSYIIKDDRLLNRLKARFPKLRHIVRIPTEENSFFDQLMPTASYFPKWFYCPRCNRFEELSNWFKKWPKEKKYFNPPKCWNIDCKEQILEQVRFVMTCKEGHIEDIPWRHWNKRLPSDQTNINEEDENEDNAKNDRPKGPQLNLSETCCLKQDLRYEISRENTELSGIWIKCVNCGNAQSLKGIFDYEKKCNGKKYWIGQAEGNFVDEFCNSIPFQKIPQIQVKVKTSNSVYYANILSSIYIPEMQNPITTETRIIIDNYLEKNTYSKDQIAEIIRDGHNIPIDVVKAYLETGDPSFISEEAFREVEYSYFLKGEQPENNQLKFRRILCADSIIGFSDLVKIEKLKKITVQTSFTRQEPIDTDSILQEESRYEYNVKRQSVSKNNFETKLLPGIESFGEAILFVLDKTTLANWELQNDIIERTKTIKTNAENSTWHYHKIIARTLSPRKILIHTLSHLVIRELQYVCGYPVSSMQERLYVSDSMNGFLISAFDGTDGYLGGLSNLCNDLEELNKIIQSAINRAKNCSSDPICLESSGQGVSQLNLAACHSCTLTPDITCELSNLFLDRKLVVDNNYGFFKAI
ncbi:MAG: DUF1998 domain-containing protein [Chitinophagaceae bacterium]|nr:DUF1998 domain-containing protein [Chitinophagaceae bacterium]